MEQRVLVFGEPITKMPKDLYIPPEALRVLLLAFEGPLDLLLYLIRKDNFDIQDIPVSEITKQYLEYIELMQKIDMNLAGEYLLMAGTLAEIKARMMLPRAKLNVEEQEDPRQDLVQQLIEYEKNKSASQYLEALPFVGQGIYLSALKVPEPIVPPNPDLMRLQLAMEALLQRQSFFIKHEVQNETFNLSERMVKIEKQLSKNWENFSLFYQNDEGKMGIVISLMAVLELDKAQTLEWTQEALFREIFVRKRDNDEIQPSDF